MISFVKMLFYFVITWRVNNSDSVKLLCNVWITVLKHIVLSIGSGLTETGLKTELWAVVMQVYVLFSTQPVHYGKIMTRLLPK